MTNDFTMNAIITQRKISHKRNRRKESFPTSKRMIIVIFLVVQMSTLCQSFQTRHGPFRTSRPHDYSNLPYADEAPSVPASFHERMLLRTKQNDMKHGSRITRSTSSSNLLIQQVRTMDEFKEVLDENHEYMVTFWVSPWCKACRSMEPAVKALAKHHPNVKFIQIPVVDDNANLHQGLEVPSVPFVHLYLKESQLAEEQKINRKKIPAFHKMLQDYENGYCSLDRHGGADQWSTSCPYNGIPAVHVPASPVTLHD